MLNRMARRGWTVLRSTCNGWRKHDGALLSAATAYYAAFSLVPLCLVLIAGLGFLERYSAVVQGQRQELLNRLARNVDPWLAGQLDQILAGVQAQAALGGPIGLIGLLLAAIGVFMQLENIFARIWDSSKPPARGWLAALRAALWDRWLAFLTVLAIGALLLGTVYQVLPKARVRWKAALGGGLLAAVVWAVGRAVLLHLVVGRQYSAYGVLGALMGAMLWFYYASAVVFLGAEFVRALEQSG